MDKITNFTEYNSNESITIEIDDTKSEGVYVLAVEDIEKIVSVFTDQNISKDAIIEELEKYQFIKIDDPKVEIDNNNIEDDSLDIKKIEL